MVNAIERGWRVQRKPADLDRAPEWTTDYLDYDPMARIRELDMELQSCDAERRFLLNGAGEMKLHMMALETKNKRFRQALEEIAGHDHIRMPELCATSDIDLCGCIRGHKCCAEIAMVALGKSASDPQVKGLK